MHSVSRLGHSLAMEILISFERSGRKRIKKINYYNFFSLYQSLENGDRRRHRR